MRIPGLELDVNDAAVPWRPTRQPGVSWLPLAWDREGGPGTDTTALIRMEPGCGYPPHRHLAVEEVLILQGGYRDRLGRHEAGTYLRYEADSAHAPIAVGDPERPSGPDNPACILFAVARGGIDLGE